MESDELRFKHIGLSNDDAVIFCELDNGKTYALPLIALEQAEDWNPKAKATSTRIIHDGYAALVEFNTGDPIDFPADFVLHVCEPSYGYHKNKRRAKSGVGERIRQIREWRGLTLEGLAAKCGIARPNLSRLENDKVTPKFETLQTVAAALGTHPVLLVVAQNTAYAKTWTKHAFTQWKLGLRWNESAPDSGCVSVRTADLVKVFLATRPEHEYARKELGAMYDGEFSMDADKWNREVVAANAALKRFTRSERIRA